MLVVDVSDTDVSLPPGGQATITVSITNTSTRVEHYVAEAVQLPDGVSVVRRSDADSSCQLSPGKQASVSLTLTARTTPPPRVGSSLIGVRVVSPHRREIQRTEEVRLVVEARPGLTLSVTPTSVTGRRRAPVAVRVDNTGNAPLDVRVTATADEARTTLVWKPGPVATAPSGVPGDALVLPGSGATLPAEVRSRARLLGRERRHRVELRAAARPVEGVPAEAVTAVDFTQPPLLPQGVVPRTAAFGGAALVAAAMVVAAKIVAGSVGAGSPEPTPSPSAVAQSQAAASPSPAASSGGSPSPSASGEASPAASASPSADASPSASGGAGTTLVDFAVPPPGKKRNPQEVSPTAYPGVTLAALPDAARTECVTTSTGLLWLLPATGTDGYVAPGHAEVIDGKKRAVCQDSALKITLAAPASRVTVSLFALADPSADLALAAYEVTAQDANGPQPSSIVSKEPGKVASATFADTSGRGILAVVVQPTKSGAGIWTGVRSLTVDALG